MRDLLNVNDNSNLLTNNECVIKEIPKAKESESLAIQMEMEEDKIQVFKFESENNSNINKKSIKKIVSKKISNILNGINFVEVLIGSLVVVLVFLLGFLFYSEQRSEDQTYSQMKSLVKLINVIDKASASQKDYSQLNTENLIKNQLIPEDFSVSKEGKVITSFDNQVTVSKANNPEQYKVTYNNVSKSTCPLMIKEGSRFFSTVELNDEIVKEQRYPLSKFLLKEFCSNKKPNTITFISDKKYQIK